jgi:FtsH-binding integral membrane protein
MQDRQSSPKEEEEFIRQTYLAFLASLVAMIALGFISYRLLPQSSFGILCVADTLIWVACGWFGWRHPIVLSFGLFTFVTGLLLGQVAHSSPHLLALTSVLSFVAFAGLSMYVHLTRQSFSFLRGFLWISFFILLGSCLLLPFARNDALDLLLAAFGTIVFSCWILYDTGELLERLDDNLTPGVAAFELILDLVGLRSWLESLLRARG